VTNDLTQATLTAALAYDAATGLFMRMRGRKGCSGRIAGSRRKDGYVVIKIAGGVFKAHRLAWLYVHGEWPAGQIDHINGVKYDNRLANLRECSNGENQQNRTAARLDNKTSGLIGVSFCNRAKRWVAQIQVNGKKVFIGYFDSPEAAHAAYLQRKSEVHPFSIRTGDRRKSSSGHSQNVLAMTPANERIAA